MVKFHRCEVLCKNCEKKENILNKLIQPQYRVNKKNAMKQNEIKVINKSFPVKAMYPPEVPVE